MAINTINKKLINNLGHIATKCIADKWLSLIYKFLKFEGNKFYIENGQKY